MIISILESLSRRVVLKRTLPSRFGHHSLFVTPDSRLSFFRKNLEKVDPHIISAAEEFVHDRDTIWDIGTNVGLFSFITAALAGPSGRVPAAEVDISLVDLLHRSSQIVSFPSE